MKKIPFQIILCSTLLIALRSVAQDQLVFPNGDVVTGKIIQQDEEQIKFKSDTLGDISVKPDQIVTIRLGSDSDTSAEPPQNNLNQWSGKVGVTLAIRESDRLDSATQSLLRDQFETYRLFGSLKRKWQISSLGWDWNYRYSQKNNDLNDEYLNITQQYRHDLSPKYFATSKTMYEQDYRRDIEHEYLQSAELGIKWWETKKLNLRSSVGGAYHQYERSDGKTEAGRLILDQSLRWQTIEALTLFGSWTHLGGVEEYHSVLSAGLENKMLYSLFLRMEYRMEHDTEAHYSNNENYTDRSLLTSLLYKF